MAGYVFLAWPFLEALAEETHIKASPSTISRGDRVLSRTYRATGRLAWRIIQLCTLLRRSVEVLTLSGA